MSERRLRLQSEKRDAAAARPVYVFSEFRAVWEALISVLGEHGYKPSFVSEASDLPTVPQASPSILVLDVKSRGAWLIAEETTRLDSSVHLVVTNVDETAEALMRWSCFGPRAWVTLSSSLTELLLLLDRVVHGEIVCSANAAPLFLSASRSAAVVSCDTDCLTRREREIVALLQEGKTNKEIALLLTLKQSTVKNHIHRIWS